MDEFRYNDLMWGSLKDELNPLTREELEIGWHFCPSWDGLLIRPGHEEALSCNCPISAVKSWQKDKLLNLNKNIIREPYENTSSNCGSSKNKLSFFELMNRDFDFIDCSIYVKNGWYGIVYNLMKSIDWFLKQENIKDFKVTEIKEKYGRLAVKTSRKIDFIDGAIYMAERQAMSACENCGSMKSSLPDINYINKQCGDCRRVNELGWCRNKDE